MPLTKVTHELPSVEDHIDTTRDDAEARIPVAVSAPKRVWRQGACQARSRSHAVQELVLQLRGRRRCRRSSPQGRRLHRPSENRVGLHVLHESRALGKSWRDRTQHILPRQPGDGSRSLYESRNCALGPILPSHLGRVGEIRSEGVR